LKTATTIRYLLRAIACLPLLLTNLAGHAQQRELDSTLQFIAGYKKEDTVKVSALLLVSDIYQTLNLEKAAEYAEQAKTLAEKTGIKYSLALAISRLASIDTWRERTTEALNGYIKQVDIGKEIGSDFILQDAYDGIAYVYELEKEWNAALQYALKSLAIAQKTPKPGDEAYAYHQMGSAHLGLNQFAEAERYLKKARGLFKSVQDTDRVAVCNVDLAKVYIQQRYYNIARPYLDTALQMFTASGEEYQVAETYHQLGRLAIRQQLWDEAEASFLKELDIYKRYPGAPVSHAHAAIGLGRVAMGRNDYKKAIAIFSEEMLRLQAAGNKERQLDCLILLARSDSATNNFKDAFYYMQRYKQLYDTVNSERKDRATQRALLELGVERQANENNLLQAKYNAQQGRLIIIISAAGLLVAGVVLLILLYRQKSEAFKAVEKLQEETAHKNREMTSANNVKDKLISMIAHDVRSPLASVQNTLTLTREGILNTDEFMQLSQMLEMDIQHLMGMLDNTLLWAREQMLDINVRKTKFKVYTVVTSVIELYQQTIVSKGVTIYNNINKNTEVYSDVDIISTVLRNILSNAVKFTPQGKSIYIEQSNLKNKILVTIKDEGVGISDDVLKKINNKEFISTRGTGNEKGTGLGLLFSKDLLFKLGEDFQMSSVLGKGTAVTISLNTHE